MNVVFWDVTPCGSSKKRRIREKFPFHRQDGKNLHANEQRTYKASSLLQFLDTANFSTSPILVTQIIVAIRSSETYVLTRATRRNIP
jgi:hypothetical protein